MPRTAAAIPPDWNRAIAYGDGLFETILVLSGAMPLWSFHRKRLQDSLHRLRLDCDLERLEGQIFTLAQQQGDGILKILIARSGGQRGYDLRQASHVVSTMQMFPLPGYADSRRSVGIRMHLCRYRLARQPALAGIKHLNRLDQVIAASEWDRLLSQEGLLLDESGAVIEGTVSNLFVVKAGKLLTPQLNYCGVAGVMRACIKEQLAPAMNIPVTESRMTLQDVLEADEFFVCNSIFGIWPVQSLGVSTLHKRSNISKALWDELQLLGYGRVYQREAA